MRLIALAMLAFLLTGPASNAQTSTSVAGSSVTQSGAAGKADKSNSAPKAQYTVKDGNKVDENTFQGWRTWRALACERCHGAAQEGLVGPSLLESMKYLTKEQFYETIMKGRPERGMPAFSTSNMVQENWEGLWAYLQGRSDGRIEPGRLTRLEDQEAK